MPIDQVMAQNLGLPQKATNQEDQRRNHERFDWRIKLQLRTQVDEASGVPYKQFDVVTHDLGAGGFSYLSKTPINRNVAILAHMPHLQQDRCLVCKVRYCYQEVGLQYRIGVKFIQRVDLTW